MASLEREWPGTAPLIHNKEQIRLRVAELWASDRVLDIVQELIGPDISGHPVSCIRTKTPNTPLMDAPWHQDAATLVAAGDRTLRPTMWLPFIDATAANGCLQLIRGGHRAQKVFPHHQQRRIGHAKSWYLYIGEDDLPEGEVVTCEVPMGGALFFTPLMPHRSLDNTSDKVRWSVDLRYQRPDDHMGFAEGAETAGLVPCARRTTLSTDSIGTPGAAARRKARTATSSTTHPIRSTSSSTATSWCAGKSPKPDPLTLLRIHRPSGPRRLASVSYQSAKLAGLRSATRLRRSTVFATASTGSVTKSSCSMDSTSS